jgi:multiple sugar transport system permease protein
VNKTSNIKVLFRYILLLVVAIIALFPIFWVISNSLKTLNGISQYPPQLIPSNPEFSNYSDAIDKGNILTYLRNTLVLMIGNTAGTLISSAIVAYPLARMEFKGKNIVFGLILATMMVPAIATIIPQFILFRYFGWIDSFKPMIVPAFFAYPYNVFLFRQFFRGLPRDLDEAAVIDGCNKVQIFTKILVPLAKPAFITVGVLSSVFWWNEMFQPLIYINSEELKPLTIGVLSAFKVQFVNQWHLQMAFSVLMMLPPILLFTFAQKYLVDGIKTSGLK